jgi:histidinol-phosphate aminotransferase
MERANSQMRLTRRRLLSAGAALPFYHEFALAQRGMRGLSADVVKINANENPVGPCPEALEAVAATAAHCGYYTQETAGGLVEAFSEAEGLERSQVAPYAGSSDPLFRTVAAFVSSSRGLVTADPTYEMAGRVAEFLGARVSGIPLRKDHSHDVKAMVEADPSAGLFYVCNPNNPSGTLTPAEDIEYLVEKKPKDSVVLVDEAYIHYTDAPSAKELVTRGKDVIVLRTFSKIYGMAGLRCGVAMGRPDLLGRIRRFGPGFLPATGMAAGEASLRAKNLVPERKKFVKELREDLYTFLEKHGFDYIPGQANFFMLNAKQDGWSLVSAMRARKIAIGRVWPIWPNHTRITIGTPAEMEKFKKALLEVMA